MQPPAACSTPALRQAARRAGRRPSLQTATLGLTGAGLLYIGSLGSLGQAELWPSLGLATLALYGSAWLYGGWAGTAIHCRHRAPWLTGAAYGELALCTTLVVACSWNVAQEAIRYAPFPGTTGADFRAHVQDSFEDYLLKPLAWVLPLGTVLAVLLGGWTAVTCKKALNSSRISGSVKSCSHSVAERGERQGVGRGPVFLNSAHAQI
ncbi:hypothetical protein [Hymenobacter ruricola]|uniref:DUF4199 domain-containing protein n=1 Tax=Hymenobacter ruricola TaxID=2791023 RepID=A0ABS0I429_9BACT|nr:hypothetical protein [Hymenobacter ruricola]MBF9221309.1 hypothetical protein [Hymenobacter ruricola]